MEAENQVSRNSQSSSVDRDGYSINSGSSDESMDSSYFEQLLQEQQEPKTRSSSRLNDKRLQTSANVSPTNDAKISISLQRLPTRRPDPNTQNRNALMARENRRKKKEYVTKLEDEIDDYKSENKKLRKIVKQQFKALEKLKHEKNYFQSILANQTQIASLVNLLKTRPRPEPYASPSNSMSSALAEFPVTGDFHFDETLLPRDPEDFFKSIPDPVICSAHAAINSEHSYSTGGGGSSSDAGVKSDPGVCLHICGDKLSLEFCVECSDNAMRSWMN